MRTSISQRAAALVRTTAVQRDRWRTRDWPDPGKPFDPRYVANHHAEVAQQIARPETLERFRGTEPLPPGYGRGYDERVVEYPWLFARLEGDRVLDAGSVLNHAHIAPAAARATGELTIVTAAPEAHAFTQLGISYVYCDLRDLPFSDGRFDLTASISTLEHVGMDNSRYGAGGRGDDPATGRRSAVAELERVTAPGGRLLITVPYGVAEDHGWFETLDRAGVEALVEAAAPAEQRVDVFAFGADGWQRSDLDAAAGARYRRAAVEPARVWAPGRAPAAEAVACLELTLR
jgi:SAM-dependent methyltransferase